MKLTFKIFGVFSLGAIAGALGVFFYFYETINSMKEVGNDLFSSAMWTYELNEANEQAKNPNHEVAIYALNRAIKNLKEFTPPQRIASCRVAPYKIATLNIQ